MKSRAGFSLIELLCTLAVMVILTVLVMGRGSPSAQKRARLACKSNLEKIGLALSLYSSDNRGAYPSLDGATTAESALSLLVPRCTALTEIFICPGSKDKELPEGEPFGNGKISYAYYAGRTTNDDPGSVAVTDAQVNSSAKLTGQPLFSASGHPPGNNHKNGGNLLQLNGAVNFSGVAAERDLPVTGKVRLLNPK
ncbi:MAG TPA: type II secretion system protein [Verrucomicrobiae bacterium]|jgi:prepilin-type N-terminal cleavage/methylation domain-containing protein|nr:type II secretion system protein [Verrucomicrobiae bacterium]